MLLGCPKGRETKEDAVVGAGEADSARAMGQELEEQSVAQSQQRQIERCWLVVVRVSVAGKLWVHQCARQQMQRGIPVKCSW